MKTNIGHTEAAAGMAGLIKVLMMMKHRRVPKSLNVHTVNPIIQFEKTPFRPALDSSDWKAADGAPLRAGISSFGFGVSTLTSSSKNLYIQKTNLTEKEGYPSFFPLKVKKA